MEKKLVYVKKIIKVYEITNSSQNEFESSGHSATCSSKNEFESSDYPSTTSTSNESNKEPKLQTIESEQANTSFQITKSKQVKRTISDYKLFPTYQYRL